MNATTRHRLGSLLESDRAADVARVLLALAGVLAFCLGHGPREAAVPALLGVIASALAETDDAWRGRLRGLIVTLICFAIAAVTVRLLMATPWMFAVALPAGTFALVMLGAASGRYATIAAATLILSVYTMIDADAGAPGARHWMGTAWMLSGAAAYGMLALAWIAFAPQRALRLALARVFTALADQLDAKAALFQPVRDLDRHALEVRLATIAGQSVQAMNEARTVLLDRMGRRQPRGRLAARLRLYFAAQDIHERISSSHYPHEALADALFHSDIMFRFVRLLHLQADACRARADEIRRVLPAGSLTLPARALDDLRAALAVGAGNREANIEEALRGLLDNVEGLQATLASGSHAPATADYALQDPDPAGVRQALANIRVQMTRQSMRFRHAVRLATGMLAGYAVLLAVHPKHGYWILLTTLFVCQPGYGATRRRLVQRVAGTALGLVIGWAVLHLLPGGDARWLIVLLSGAAFFALQRRRYTLATATITLFVLLCFDQAGASYDAITPRLLDTLLGSAIAAFVLRFVLPDWHARRLDDVLADAIAADAAYLRSITAQYLGGKRDDLPYRIARRDAHNGHAALAGSINAMLAEPAHTRSPTEHVLRLLTLSQQVLAHLSTLGAHRQVLPAGEDADATMVDLHRVADGYQALALALRGAGPFGTVDPPWLASLGDRASHATGPTRLVNLQALLLARAQGAFTTMRAGS